MFNITSHHERRQTIRRLSILILSGFLLAYFQSPSFGEEEKVKLEIESEPSEFAADLHIAQAQGKPVSPDDRKRTRLGAGESAKLTLTGKEALIEYPDKLVWRIEPGKGDKWAKIKTRKNEPNLLVAVALTINEDLIFDSTDSKDPEKETGDTPFQTEGEINVQGSSGGGSHRGKILHRCSSLRNHGGT